MMHQTSETDAPLREVTLRDVIADCGGASVVAAALNLAKTTIYDWARQGRVPDSDLKTSDGTNYSDAIAGLQQEGRLTAAQIRRLGRRL
ncbi:hypothetical protein ACJ7V3_11725 [Halomonas elongata]|uniref:hypothetical protein n=1 Tax=Halomonas elongata TaxID=2746 RepID=UPI0038D45752